VKGEIVSIIRMIDDNDNIRGYQIVVETHNSPDFKLGDCEIKQ